MMSLWDALRMNMMISYQELVRTFLNTIAGYLRIPVTELRLSDTKVNGLLGINPRTPGEYLNSH
ncbi:Uncharacterised protein [Klebsiella pneumoniae]|nr:Uncharacterised protein [Klebsiella pneumoniae]